MSGIESKIPPAAPRNRPKPPTQELTDEEKEQKLQDIIQSAPLQTNPDDATNPAPVERVKKAKPKVKPWRLGFQDRDPAELSQMKVKTSFTQVKEIELRLEFILSNLNNNRGLGSKTYVNQLIIEALDEYTRKKLNELGHDVD